MLFSFIYCNFFSNDVIVTLSSMMPRSSLMLTRFCSIESRSRSVTVLSSSVWWSTVTQYGVPMAS